jgi:hypothetical protein
VLCTYSKRGYPLANYGQFRRLIPDHTDFPDTYDEWLNEVMLLFGEKEAPVSAGVFIC